MKGISMLKGHKIALENAIRKKIFEAEIRLKEAQKIFEYLSQNNEIQFPTCGASEDEGPGVEEIRDVKREGLYPGQLDNIVDYEDEDGCEE